MSNPIEEIVRPQALLHEMVDGDTYDLLVNWKRRRDWRHASVERLRLRDYSARELRALGPTRVDPRVSGTEATRIASWELRTAKVILVEHQGIDSFGRDVCWIWVDGESLGARLLARGAVTLAKKEG